MQYKVSQLRENIITIITIDDDNNEEAHGFFLERGEIHALDADPNYIQTLAVKYGALAKKSLEMRLVDVNDIPDPKVDLTKAHVDSVVIDSAEVDSKLVEIKEEEARQKALEEAKAQEEFDKEL